MHMSVCLYRSFTLHFHMPFYLCSMKPWLLVIVIFLLFVVELLRIWFIMPFPGSQEGGTLRLAYFMSNNIWWMRLLLYIITAQFLFRFILRRKVFAAIIVFSMLIIYGVMTYYLVYKLNASAMFKQQQNPVYATAADNRVNEGKLVIGVVINGEAKAYPIEIIGYHHQVRDVIGRQELMVTYCTVCRSGRVFSPVVNGNITNFSLVGMDKFNAMFEDEETGSWWQQATGIAIAGKMKGTALPEIYSRQMSLHAWLTEFPDSKILQPDDNFLKQYNQLTGYDEGKVNNDLEHRDPLPWQNKSWVIVAKVGEHKRAYDYAELEKRHVINDTLGGKEIAVTLALDNKSFYAFERRNDGVVYQFFYDSKFTNGLGDNNSNLTWSFSGQARLSEDSTIQLRQIPVYQEFYHTFKDFE